MEIIPVIDLLNGCVVHAQRGERQHYAPIRSSLCDGCEPITIVGALLELYPFSQLYIADLDAIQKRGNHRQVISEIQTHYPNLDIWLDAGLGFIEDLNAWHGMEATWVIGSESLHSLADYTALRQRCGKNHVLSVDFSATSYQGPVELLEASAQWPDKVIAMTLNQVGSNLGPDFQLLAELVNRGSSAIYAAGGARHIQDIRQLQDMGVTGVLIASALHTRQISGMEISELLSSPRQ
jgi:phosphoribosylformimino-5-aminoimidazole carboxamide ribotide isomerase